MMTQRLLLPLAISAVSVMCGCGLVYEYDDCPPCPEECFSVDADWKYAPSALPEGMAYIFFQTGGTDEWRFDFPGREGGEADLPDGGYSVIMFNDDTSGILFENTDIYETFTFYCRRGGLYDGLGGSIDNPLGPDTGPDGEKVEICPDMLWCDAEDRFSLFPGGTSVGKPEASYSHDRTLVMYPHQIVARYSLTIRDVSNLGGVARMCASLSGMASSLRPSDMFRDGPATLPFKVGGNGIDVINGSFLTYGLPSEGDVPNMLSLYVWLSDGRKLCYNFDVSPQTRTAADPLNVNIILSGLDLPESDIPTEGGFDVSVDGWTTIEIDIQS